MSTVHWHLILNHVPIIGSLFGTLVLLWGVIRKNDSVKNVGLFTLVVAALLTIPTLATGHEAEEFAEHLPGISEAEIHEHEEVAETAAWIMYATGFLALVGLILIARRHHRAGLFVIPTLILAVVSSGFMVYTGNRGGMIRHTQEFKNDLEAEEAYPAGKHDHEEHEH